MSARRKRRPPTALLPRSKRTLVVRLVYSARGPIYAKIQQNQPADRSAHAYECMSPTCSPAEDGVPFEPPLNFRVIHPPSAEVARHGAGVWCPACQGLYVEWLSFDVPPEDVFLDTEEEWAQVPRGRALKRDRIQCRTCGQAFDPGQLDQVFFHEHQGLSESVGPTGIEGECAS